LKIASLLFGWAALFCAFPASAQENIKLLYTPGVGFVASYVAEDQGYFKARGLDVGFTPTPISSNIIPIVVSGEAQIGGVTIVSMLQANDNGLDLVLVGGGVVSPQPGSIFVARTGVDIEKPADLKGKTVGVPGIGASAHIILRRVLEMNGVDSASVKFVEVGYPQAAEMLKSGQIDAYPIVPPFTGRVLQSGAAKEVANWPDPEPDGTPSVVYAATRKWALAHRPQIEAWRDAMKEAVAYIKAHPQEAYPSVATYTKLPPEVATSIPMPILDVDLTPKQVQFWIDLAKEENIIKNAPDARSLLVP